MTDESDRLYDRIKGAVYGAAIGDALGATFEFLTSARIERELGAPIALEYRPAVAGSLLHPREAGLPTDDTAMALALVDAIADGATDAVSLARCFFTRLHRTGAYGTLFWGGGPGGACVSMLRQLENGAAPFEGISRSAGGNGAAMRAYSCGAYSDRSRVSDLAATQAALSHGHPGAIAAAQFVALVVHEALQTGVLPTAFPAEVEDDTMRAAWDKMPHTAKSPDRLPDHLCDVDMAGWNTVTTAHAIAVMYAEDPERAIGFASASGQDTDTVASIVGAMVGAANGFSALPTRWASGIAVSDLLDVAARKLYEVARA